MSESAAAEPATPLTERYAHALAARGYQADAAQQDAVAALDALRTQLIASGEPGFWSRLRRLAPRTAGQAAQGLYLWGGVGRGKTWLMDLFYDSLPLKGRRRSHFQHFMRDVHRSLRQTRAQRDPLELVAGRLAAQLRVLCLDELYVNDIADAMILGGLFEALLRRGVTLVITSNVPPAELYRGGLQRERFLPAIALLQRELLVLPVDAGVDYRLRQLQRRRIYLDSADPATPAAMRALFDELAGEHGDGNGELQIAGRTLRALARRGEVAWFRFDALCEGPRSQNDYADLAQMLRTVLISDIPVFASAGQDNAARRFIWLIDEFYDQGVKMVLSAAAAPDALYRGERLAFEFRRTASRLTEMQTQGYLARPHRT